MADYREISQDYARGAINAAMLVNGGAAVALLSQLSALQDIRLAVESALIFWSWGVSFAMFSWVMAFASTRYVDKSIDESASRSQHLTTSNRFMAAGLLLVTGSIVLFIAGCYRVASAFGA